MTFSMHARVAPDVMIRDVGDESVILDLKSETYSGLDAVGARMWKVLTTAPTIEDAYQALLQEYEVDPDRLRGDIERFVATLVEQGLVVLAEADPNLA